MQWIYDWFEIDATSPKKVEAQIADANGEDLEVIINSRGGDVWAGAEIYTTIMEYHGNVIVKIPAFAGSAASIIAMAGKVVKISPPAQIMIHNVLGSIQGDYRDMQHEADVLKNYNTSIANAYMLKTKMSQEDLLKLMDSETWMNAQQAKELGFADEIMFDDEFQLVASDVNSQMIPPQVISKFRNEFTHLIKAGPEAGFNNTKKQDPAPEPQPVNKKEEGKLIKTVDELRTEHPELVAQVEAAARDEGAANERKRIQAIDDISTTIAPELVNKAKYEEPMNAETLAFQALKDDAGKGRKYLDDTHNDSEESGTKNINGQPQDQRTSAEQKAEAETKAAEAIANYANQRRA